jgi:glycosyltransferase involved in cell wall biosynthesis
MHTPFFSIVTISFNQAQFLLECIESVFAQDFNDYEYIVHDPGSVDGSREIIKTHLDKITTYSSLTDSGPADGLNKAFTLAKGKYFLFINSDDRLMPGSLRLFHNWITSDKCRHDVYSGGCRIVNKNGLMIRKAYSDAMNLRRAAYGQCILIQQSTAVCSKAYKAVGGFNAGNTSNWDGELYIDIARNGGSFARSSLIFSDYRIHDSSITGTGSRNSSHLKYGKLMYERITGKSASEMSSLSRRLCWLERRILNPLDTLERIKYGPIYKQG